MCFSENVSLATYCFGLISCLLCWTINQKNYKIVAIFFSFVISMQLIEFLLWRHQICDSYNKFISVLGMLLNHFQPFMLLLTILWLKNNEIASSAKYIMSAILAVYIPVILLYSIQYFKTDMCTIKSELHKHLVWKWNTMKYYKLTYAIFLITVTVISYIGINTTTSLVIFFTYLLSHMIYRHQLVVGTMWCFFAAFIPIIYYLYAKLGK